MERLVIVLVVVLAVIAVAQLLRVYEQVSALKGNKEEEISLKDNKTNANLLLAFMVCMYALFIWLTAEYAGDRYGKGPSASDIGDETDWLLQLNMVIITITFFICNTLLFGFAWKYYYRKERKALYYPHNNKLELVWTVIPAAVLAVIIILGLRTWFDVMDKGLETVPEGTPLTEQPVEIEIYAKQFDFAVRYGGDDNKLGQTDYKLVHAGNPLGVLTLASIDTSIKVMTGELNTMQSRLMNEGDYLPDWQYDEIESRIVKYNRLRRRLSTLRADILRDTTREWNEIANNDVVIPGPAEIYLIKGKRYNFTFRAEDVIHSAYFPHFRAQMNMVPGATTYFSFTPTMTTEEMQEELDNPDFFFQLVCNKICGESHYKMNSRIVVGDEEGFRQWLAAQKAKTFGGEEFPYVQYPDANNPKHEDRNFWIFPTAQERAEFAAPADDGDVAADTPDPAGGDGMDGE